MEIISWSPRSCSLQEKCYLSFPLLCSARDEEEEPKLMLITELAPKGSLDKYLVKHKEASLGSLARYGAKYCHLSCSSICYEICGSNIFIRVVFTQQSIILAHTLPSHKHARTQSYVWWFVRTCLLFFKSPQRNQFVLGPHNVA